MDVGKGLTQDSGLKSKSVDPLTLTLALYTESMIFYEWVARVPPGANKFCHILQLELAVFENRPFIKKSTYIARVLYHMSY